MRLIIISLLPVSLNLYGVFIANVSLVLPTRTAILSVQYELLPYILLIFKEHAVCCEIEVIAMYYIVCKLNKT